MPHKLRPYISNLALRTICQIMYMNIHFRILCIELIISNRRVVLWTFNQLILHYLHNWNWYVFELPSRNLGWIISWMSADTWIMFKKQFVRQSIIAVISVCFVNIVGTLSVFKFSFRSIFSLLVFDRLPTSCGVSPLYTSME